MPLIEPEHLEQALRARPRRWLVTGAAGFIGSHLIERLLRLEQTVTGLDNFSLGRRDNLAQVCAAVGPERWRRFRLIEGDVRLRADCARACAGADVVLHQAALGSVPLSLEDPIAAHDVNVTGFVNVLQAARAAGAQRVVYASSSAIYGDRPEVPSVEDAIGTPLSPYGLNKLIDEQYAAAYARCFGLATVGLRYFNVFGPRQDPHGAYAAVIPAWLGALVRGEPAYINGDGRTTRDFCYVDNVVQANLLAAATPRRAALNQVYNVGAGLATSLDQLFALIRDELARHDARFAARQPLYRDFRPGDIACSVGDCGKAARLLGYAPTVRVPEGLARTVDWYVARLAKAAA